MFDDPGENMMEKDPPFTNRLSMEKSPYLLQHAHNPVDWYPWGEEAFAAAKEQDKPVFLSIGYAACHWCHVMEEESFANLEVAQLLNDAFINIKVDKEELPAIDAFYMEFAQGAMGGAVGWPLNLILNPEGIPFYAVTYLPPEAKKGMVGLKELISRIKEMWDGEEREEIEEQTETILESFEEDSLDEDQLMPEQEFVEETADLLFQLADPIYGGMRGRPKFPIGYQASFLLRYMTTGQERRSLFFVEKTFDCMLRGGIYDHLGGGFSRYAIDDQWLIPHFEKMLYDNAQLISAYTELWQVTRQARFAKVAHESISYLIRDLSNEAGGFFSSQDADSEGVEGLFYTWTVKELQSVLNPKQTELASIFYNVTPYGNFHGRNILHTPTPLEELAGHLGRKDKQDLEQQLDEIKQTLWKAREQRIHPALDDKCVTAWNGLMIHALAEAGLAYNHQPYLDAAEKTAIFIRDHLWIRRQLFRSWRGGEVSRLAVLSDYACLIKGLLTLFQSGRSSEWLRWSIELTRMVEELFISPQGSYYESDKSDPCLPVRFSHFEDGAEPSGNAIQTENLLRLWQITGDATYLYRAEAILKSAQYFFESYPLGYLYHVMNLNRYYDTGAANFVIALDKEKTLQNEIAAAIESFYLPHKVVVWKQEGDDWLEGLSPSLRDKVPVDGKTAFYSCTEKGCLEAITDIDKIKKYLSTLK